EGGVPGQLRRDPLDRQADGGAAAPPLAVVVVGVLAPEPGERDAAQALVAELAHRQLGVLDALRARELHGQVARAHGAVLLAGRARARAGDRLRVLER